MPRLAANLTMMYKEHDFLGRFAIDAQISGASERHRGVTQID